MTSRDAVLSLGLETIEVVAKRLHPERTRPAAAVHRAGGAGRHRARQRQPARLPRRQLSRWATASRLPSSCGSIAGAGRCSLAEKGYDLWRIVRLLNPVSAATQELRERFTRQIYEAGREHLARRLARAYVKEVGRAAIDLYGGNLRVTRASARPRHGRLARGLGRGRGARGRARSASWWRDRPAPASRASSMRSPMPSTRPSTPSRPPRASPPTR